MKPRISPRDLELLSQYLDQQLGPIERKRLEARLADEAALQAVFEDLQKTRLLLRSMPRLRAPRNFTLSQHQLPSRAVRRWAPAMGFVSALASLLLLLVVAGDLFGLFLPARVARLVVPAAPEVKSFQGISPTGLAEATQQASSAILPKVTSPVSQDQATNITPTETQAPLAAIAEAPQAPTGTSLPDEAEREMKNYQVQPGVVMSTPGQSLGASSQISESGTLTTTEILKAQVPSAEEALQTTEQPAPAPANIPPQPLEKLEATPSSGQEESAEVMATPEGLDQSQPGPQINTSNAGERGTSSFARWLLWILEALLALVALGAGILAWVLRRQQRR